MLGREFLKTERDLQTYGTGDLSGAIEGTVAGDVFRFKDTRGNDLRQRLQADRVTPVRARLLMRAFVRFWFPSRLGLGALSRL